MIMEAAQRLLAHQNFFREYTAAAIRTACIAQTKSPSISMGFQIETASKIAKSVAVLVKMV